LSRRAWVIILVLLVIAGGATYVVISLGRQAQEPRYVTATAEAADIVLTVTGTGPLAPSQIRDVLAPTSGEVSQVFADEGSRVARNDQVVHLSSRDLEFQVQTAEMDLESARLSLRETLGIGPDESVPTEISGALESVVAPSRGRIVRVLVEAGDRIAKDALLFEMVDDRRARFEFRISPATAGRIEVGDDASVYLERFDELVSAEVVEVNDEPTPGDSSALATVALSLENPAGLIESGFSGNVTMEVGDAMIVRPGETVDLPRIRVFAEKAGRVQSMEVREGRFMDAGETVMHLSTTDHSLRVTQALLRVRQAEVQLARRREQRDELMVMSPIEGEVIRLHVQPGERLNARAPIAEIACLDPFEIVIDVDELEIASLTEGMTAEVKFDALPGFPVSAEVHAIARTGDVRDGVTTYPVTLRLPSEDRMRVGMSTDITIEVDRRESVLSVPAEAITIADDGASVRLVEDGEVQARGVETGLTDGVRTEILSGIEAGDEVIISAVETEMMFFMGPGGGG